jgi:hypothetical protein
MIGSANGLMFLFKGVSVLDRLVGHYYADHSSFKPGRRSDLVVLLNQKSNHEKLKGWCYIQDSRLFPVLYIRTFL